MSRTVPLVIATIASLCFSVDQSFSDDPKKTALTSIGAVSSLDADADPFDPGIGGGFDQKAYFQNRYIPKLADCTDQIESVFVDWANTHEMVLPRREAELGNILIHATRENIGGLFELSYNVELERERARVSVFYLKKDGSQLDPALVKNLLETWGIAALQDNLDAALKCDQA